MTGSGRPGRIGAQQEASEKATASYGYILPCKVGMVNHRAGKVRCVVHDGSSDAFLTEWIPWLTQRAGNNRYWEAPEAGEKGLLLSPSGRPKNGYFLPGVFNEGAQLPCDDPDTVKKIYLDEKVGLYEYNRRTGRRRWRLHGAGEFRQEIGLFEQSGDKGTSDIIQSRDMIQLRVGDTRMVIKDGLFRFFMKDPSGEVVELKIDHKGLSASVNEVGVFNLEKEKAVLGVLESAPTETNEMQEDGSVKEVTITPPMVGLIFDKESAQMGCNEKSIVRATNDSITAELIEEEPDTAWGTIEAPEKQGSSKLAIRKDHATLQVKKSAVSITPLLVDARTPGTSATLTEQSFTVVSFESLVVQMSAEGAVYSPEQFLKFKSKKKGAAPLTPFPAPKTDEFKPFMPPD